MAGHYRAIFVDVDTQFDFMDPQGALYVPGAEQIVPNLRRLFSAALEYDIPVISSADCHAPDDPEFATYGFPPHCVAGTPGQQRLPATLLADRAVINPDETVQDLIGVLERHRQVIFNKQSFDVWANPNAARLLKQLDTDAWYVFGVATEYCVRAAAIGLALGGRATWVVQDAVKAVAPDTQAQALEEMTAAGIRFITTDQVVRTVQDWRALREQRP